MHILITTGPTREYIDEVRFITNASSGRMGHALAEAALAAGHRVTLLSGPVCLDPPSGVTLHRFRTVEELKALLHEHFPACDALLMGAAVGDFRAESPRTGKLSRSDGPLTLRLTPTEDLLASLKPLRREGQVVVAFAVEAGPSERIEAKARDDLTRKGADMVVLNRPEAMAAEKSEAAILSADKVLLPWAKRNKTALAREIFDILSSDRNDRPVP
jgi:phosphopantothenoylcysteine decarboxylase/phosphopantothenate--cysteine ligase